MVVRSAAVDLLLDLLVLAQSTPFGPVPTPQPTVAPGAGEDDVSRQTLYLIAFAVLVGVVALGYFIARDARRSLPPGELDATPRPQPPARPRKPRAKAKAARRARRQNR